MTILKTLLEYGVTAPHVIDYMKRELVESNGYTELNLEDSFTLIENEKYYVNLYGTNGMAFCIGKNLSDKPILRIALAHSDYPCFQIKPNPMIKGKHVVKLNVELYGGMNQKSWFDRPLGIAGKVVVKGDDAFTPKTLLYKSDSPLCIIPSLAIHMDRDLNKKGELDKAKELVPLIALDENADLLNVISNSLSVELNDILDYDLYLYNMEPPTVCGADQSMMAAPKLDNLTSVAALLEGMIASDVPDNTIDVMVVFDNEEVGSLSKQGADSELLTLVLKKIGAALHLSQTFIADVATKSFLLSVDVAHANHPNYEDKSDANNRAYLGKGFSLKRSVGQKYGTTAESAAVVKAICEQHNIPYTIAINKTGIPGGSTLGPIVTSHLPFPCADIGMPILAMHSAMELGAVADYVALKQFVKAFYSL
ncbi:MAG: M18 family aminopeptidase [Lachnospiraceae bacterium]|nr:M18 family aminopeptidase [Lachnospiraceae bacterium]